MKQARRSGPRCIDRDANRRDRVRRKIDAALQLEPIDRLDQADRAHLDEILELLAVADVTPCQSTDERQILLDQAGTGSEVTVAMVLAEQAADCCMA